MPANSDPFRIEPGFPTGLLIELDRLRGSRIRSQLESELRQAVVQQRVAPGAKLPASRTLARELGISRSVVVEAYSQLVAEGYLETAQGVGTKARSTPILPLATRPNGRARLNPAFITGLPDPALFPRKEWLRSYRSAITDCADEALGLPEPQGRVELRTVLADYLGRVRSVQCSADQIIICNGISQAIGVTCRTIRARGSTRIAVEDPCFAAHRQLIAACGLTAVPIDVDEHGVRTDRLIESDVTAVLLAPAHSYPSGAVLSRERRVALTDWARRRDVLIIEDDYDAEFRFDSTPIGALHALAPGHVVHAGSVSKVLNPSLRLGWMAAPDRLVRDLVATKFTEDVATDAFGQLALARFIETGAFARHIRKLRPLYRARRDLLLQELRARAPELVSQGVEAGLHLYLRLPDGVREDAVIAAAGKRGLRVEGAARHRATAGAANPAILVGYGMLAESAIARDVAALVAAIRGAAG
jgi:GntR family transcriptional regulator / MocR family aminotransferase